MNKLFSFLGLVAVCLGFSLSTASAQELVTTGIVQGVDVKAGTLTVRSDQTQKPFIFYGLAQTNIFTVDGQPALLNDLQMGTKVTVQYAQRAQQLYVSKVMFGEVKTPGQRSAEAATSNLPAGVQMNPNSTLSTTPGDQGKVRPLVRPNINRQ